MDFRASVNLLSGGSQVIVDIKGGTFRERTEVGRLVVVAPALLDGLRQAVEQLELDYEASPLDGHGALIRKLRAILAKADGPQ